MIITKNNLQPGQVLDADICIVGSGPAAISIALSLNACTANVIVISGGGWSETIGNQDLNRGTVWPAGSHEPPEENRRRQFGGTSAAWGGRCMPFEPVDFKERSWVPESGWPITYDDLLPYYEKAAEVCQIGSFEFDATKAFPTHQREILTGLDSDELISYPLERWSPPVHFAKTYKKELTNSTNVRVLLDAHVLSLQMPEDNRVGSADVSMGDGRLTVKATYFVLATGGIENARLLLASANNYFPTGIGNQHDNVGRYYMNHISGTYAEVRLHDKTKLLSGFEMDTGGVYCRRRWWVPETAQEARKLMNNIFFLYHPTSTSGHRDVIFSSIFVAKSVLSVLGQKSMAKAVSKAKQLLPSMKEHAVNVARNGLSQLPDMVRLGMKRLGKRRLPYILPAKNNEYWGLYFQAEQAPNRESRICLSASEKDAYGMPRADVRLAFLDIDIDSIVENHNLFAANFKARNLGEIRYDEEGLRQYLHERLRSFNSSAHHIGTTRMSDDPRTGVVDSQARVHGVNNLFVAGASVFPTGGHANPTFTIVAQALRLADHLKQALVSRSDQRVAQPSAFVQTDADPVTQ